MPFVSGEKACLTGPAEFFRGGARGWGNGNRNPQVPTGERIGANSVRQVHRPRELALHASDEVPRVHTAPGGSESGQKDGYIGSPPRKHTGSAHHERNTTDAISAAMGGPCYRSSIDRSRSHGHCPFPQELPPLKPVGLAYGCSESETSAPHLVAALFLRACTAGVWPIVSAV
jgi:hypothetical protein